MKPECIQAINSVSVRVLTNEELRRIEEDIIHQYAKVSQEGHSRAERYRLAGEKAQEARVKETVEQLHSRIDDAYKINTILQDIDQVQAGVNGKSQALFNKLFHCAGSAEVPLEMEIKAHSNSVLSNFSPYVKKWSKNLGFSADKQFGLDFFNELLGKPSQNEHASHMVNDYRKLMKDLHVQAEEAGIGFKFCKNRIPQPMDPSKLYATPKNDFVQSVLNWIDRSKYTNADGSHFSDVQMESLLKGIYDERTSSSSPLYSDSFSPKVGKKRTFERVLHFKDANAHMDFMEKFGTSTDIPSILISDFQSLSRDIVIARKFGADADTVVKGLIDKVLSQDKDASRGSAGADRKLRKRQESMLNMWEVMRYGETPENSIWANRGAGLRSLAQASMLGKHTIGSLLEDGFLSRMMLGRIGIGKEEIKLIKSLPRVQRKEMFSDIGLFAEGVIAHGRNTIDSFNAPNIARNLESKMHYLSMAEYLDHKRLSTHALIVYNQIGRMTEKYQSLSELMSDKSVDMGVKNFFKQFKDIDFQVIKRAKPISGIDGEFSIKTPRSIHNIAPELLKDLAPDSRSINLLKDTIETKLNALALANLQTSLRGASPSSLWDKQRLGLLTYKNGTPVGELLRFFYQFTPTTTGLFLTHMYDLPQSSKMPLGASMNTSNAWVQYTALMVVAGVGTAIIKSLLKGEDPSLSRVIKEGVFHNGALFPFLDRLTKLYGWISGGQSFDPSIVFGAAPNAIANVLTGVHKSITGDKEASKSVIKSIGNMIPFMRVWYFENAFEHMMINQLIEFFNPGYLAKQQRKKEKKILYLVFPFVSLSVSSGISVPVPTFASLYTLHQQE